MVVTPFTYLNLWLGFTTSFGMKLLYIANQRMPTEKAYGRQIVKMCESFANLGVEVELVAPGRNNLVKEDLFDYYSLQRNFKFTTISSPDWYWSGRLDKLAFWIKNFISAKKLANYALKGNYDLIYSRDEFPVYFLLNKKPIFFEAHKFIKSYGFFYQRFKKSSLKIVAITHGLKNEFIKNGFQSDHILVAPDGVDEERIKQQSQNPISQEEARHKLNLPLCQKIIVYAGSLYKWKGIFVLAEAAKLLKEEVVVVAVGGGQNSDQLELQTYLAQNQIKNFLITGYITNSKTRDLYRSAADVLVLPNTSQDKISEIYTSPLKLFSYMASRRPIVASDLLSLREVLNEKNAVLVQPDSPIDLADGLQKVLADPAGSALLAEQAFGDVQKYTWQKRARTILNLME